MNSATKPLVLVADDDGAFRRAMTKALSRMGFPILEASSGEEAVKILKEGKADVALLDLQLGDMDGLEVLSQVGPTRTKVIVVTGHGTIAAAVQAMRLGAAHFVQKPIDAPALLPFLEDALVSEDLGHEEEDDLGLVGESAALERIRSLIRRAGPTDETVLVTGESGTGKELVARALHASSPRASGPFLAINCAQAHKDLFDAELFGYVRGAFTGAAGDRQGLFREANGGTLFLDEIGELPLSAQAKLLRVLETNTVRPVGGTREEPIDVRVVAATNRDLVKASSVGEFREDLLFRLHVLSLEIPPLRTRKEDIGPIAKALLRRIATGRDRSLTLHPSGIDELERYDWPGNVRELANVLKRAAIFNSSGQIGGQEIREAIGSSIFGHPEARASLQTPAKGEELTLAEMEKRHILETFDRHHGNVTHAAQSLGIDRRTLQRKLRGYGREPGDDA